MESGFESLLPSHSIQSTGISGIIDDFKYPLIKFLKEATFFTRNAYI